MEGRLDQLYRLKKKYGPDVESMLAYLDRSTKELDAIEDAGDTLLHLQQLEKKALVCCPVCGGGAVQGPPSGGRAAGGADPQRAAPTGYGPHPLRHRLPAPAPVGVRYRTPCASLCLPTWARSCAPSRRIASGGELARIMLAMKNVLSEQDRVGTMVFDEVDTGVSGRAAQKVAEKMARISRTKQVLCVTHLPQLAAMADTHFSVERGRHRRPHLYPCAAAGSGPAAAGAGPPHRRRPHHSHHAGRGREELAVCGGGFQAHAGIGLESNPPIPPIMSSQQLQKLLQGGGTSSSACTCKESLCPVKRGEERRCGRHPGAAVPTPFRGERGMRSGPPGASGGV